MPPPTKESKKAKKKRSNRKIRQLFNFVGGGGNAAKKEEDASTSQERVASPTSSAVKKTSDYYLSKIQALEKAIAEMRAAGKKTTSNAENATVSQQAEEKSRLEIFCFKLQKSIISKFQGFT